MPYLTNLRRVTSYKEEQRFRNGLEEIGDFLHKKYLAQKFDKLKNSPRSHNFPFAEFILTKINHATFNKLKNS